MHRHSLQQLRCFSALVALGLTITSCTSPESAGAGSAPSVPLSEIDQEVPAAAPDACVPDCAERQCGEDGCGGRCGDCPVGELCTEDGVCFRPAAPSDCEESCEALGYECGEACGLSCGQCEADARCEEGRCVCQPDCVGKLCGAEDGCGGVCTPCPNVESCADCAARLSIHAEERDEGGTLRAVTVAVEFTLDPSALPTMADLRLSLSGPGQIQQVALGDPLVNSDKQLMKNPRTGSPIQVKAEGIHRLLVLSTQSLSAIQSGRWLYLKVAIGDTAREGPVELAIVKREQILAPIEADQQLWRERYEAPLVIWPEVRNED